MKISCCNLQNCLRHQTNCFFLTDPERIGVLLSSSIFEAHTRTILMTHDTIRERCRAGVDQQKLFLFKNMVSKYIKYLMTKLSV